MSLKGLGSLERAVPLEILLNEFLVLFSEATDGLGDLVPRVDVEETLYLVLNVIGGPSFFDVLEYALFNRLLVSVDKSFAVNLEVVLLGGDGSFFKSLTFAVLAVYVREYVFGLSSSIEAAAFPRLE